MNEDVKKGLGVKQRADRKTRRDSVNDFLVSTDLGSIQNSPSSPSSCLLHHQSMQSTLAAVFGTQQKHDHTPLQSVLPVS